MVRAIAALIVPLFALSGAATLGSPALQEKFIAAVPTREQVHSMGVPLPGVESRTTLMALGPCRTRIAFLRPAYTANGKSHAALDRTLVIDWARVIVVEDQMGAATIGWPGGGVYLPGVADAIIPVATELWNACKTPAAAQPTP